MAVRFDATTDQLTYSGALPDPRNGLTITGWVMIEVDRNDYQTFLRMRAGGTTGTFATQNDGTTGPNWFTAGGSVGVAFSMAPGIWYPVAVVQNGTAATVYVREPDGTLRSASGTVGGDTNPTDLSFGGRGGTDTTEWFNGREGLFRMITAVLAPADLEAEWDSLTPVHAAVVSAWPLNDATDLADHVGTRNLVAGSTPVTTADGPPVTPPIEPATGDLAAVAPAPVAAVTVKTLSAGDLAASAPAAVASLDGALGPVPASGDLQISAPAARAAFDGGTTPASGTLTATAPAARASLRSGDAAGLGLRGGPLQADWAAGPIRGDWRSGPILGEDA